MNKRTIVSLTMGGVGLVLIIVSLALVYSYPARTNPVDQKVNNFFVLNQNTAIEEAMDIISDFGEAFIYVGVLAILYYAWDKKKAFRGIVVTISSAVVNSVGKNSFRQDRPVPSVASYGLPSGHAQVSSSFWGILAVLVKKWWLIILAITFSLFISFSRIYLLRHWFTDVLIGIGLALVTISVFLILDEPLSNHINNQSILRKVLYITALSLILVLPIILLQLHLGNEGIEGIFGDLNLIAFFISLSICYVFEEKLVNHNNEVDKKWKIFVRILFGLALSGLFYGFTQIVDELGDENVITPVATYIMNLIGYTLLGPLLILLIPWIMKKLKV